MNRSILQRENSVFGGGGGVSANNRCFGFQPAFRNREDGCIYASRFANGLPAPIHLIDGLPDELVVERSAAGKVTAIKPCVQAGFLLHGRFYDREQASRYSQQLLTGPDGA